LEEQFPDSTSSFAEEGTAGHALAEHLIKKYLKIRSKRPTSDYFTDEIVESVNDYVSFVTEQIDKARTIAKLPVFNVEMKVDVSNYVDECFGTADMVIVTDNKVHIIDLKLGKGVPVYAENNTQLMIYGLGVLEIFELLYDIETIQLTIHQPRLQNVSTWEISTAALKEWAEKVLRSRGAMALSGNGDFEVGEHCRFCKAKNQCRARANEMLKLAQFEFKAAPLLTDDEISEVLSKADELSKWASDVYAYAQEEAVNNGRVWNGFKLVRGKTNRRYTDEADVIEKAKAYGYEDIYKTSLIGITEMEKLMGKDNFKNILGDLVYKPEGKLTLVSNTDKREEVHISRATDDFKEEN
jgi:hypothetical protein